MIDGQHCRLDSKYGRIFTKENHVPIVMIANKLPQGMKGEGPFRERFIRLQFSTHIEDLEEERVIATLWGCVKRRLNQIEANVDSAKGINLHYNQDPYENIDRKQT